MKAVGIERERVAASVITTIKAICVINAKIPISFSRLKLRRVRNPNVHGVISLARYVQMSRKFASAVFRQSQRLE